jgi:hypothetical protein
MDDHDGHAAQRHAPVSNEKVDVRESVIEDTLDAEHVRPSPDVAENDKATQTRIMRELTHAGCPLPGDDQEDDFYDLVLSMYPDTNGDVLEALYRGHLVSLSSDDKSIFFGYWGELDDTRLKEALDPASNADGCWLWHKSPSRAAGVCAVSVLREGVLRQFCIVPTEDGGVLLDNTDDLVQEPPLRTTHRCVRDLLHYLLRLQEVHPDPVIQLKLVQKSPETYDIFGDVPNFANND